MMLSSPGGINSRAAQKDVKCVCLRVMMNELGLTHGKKIVESSSLRRQFNLTDELHRDTQMIDFPSRLWRDTNLKATLFRRRRVTRLPYLSHDGILRAVKR